MISNGDDFTQRAYVLNCQDKKSDHLDLELQAHRESPLVNISMLLKGWETENITIQMNGNILQKDKDYRTDKIRGLDRDDLIIWNKNQTVSTTSIHITKQNPGK